METGFRKVHCVKCEKARSTLKCAGCLQDFCYNHLPDHRQELSEQLHQIEMNRDLLRQTLNEQTNNPEQHLLIKQIDQWEKDSIKIIEETAQECRQFLFEHTTKSINQTETNLANLTDEMRKIRKENDFNEIDLNQLKNKLTELAEEVNKLANVSVQQETTALINKIRIVVSSSNSFHILPNSTWKQNGITIAGGNEEGNQLNQLSSPDGLYVDDDNQCIYIVDCENYRIVEWKFGATKGQVVAGGNGKGNRIDQLNGPRAVIVDKNSDSLIIADQGNKRVVRWSRENDPNPQIIISDIDCFGLTMNNNGDLYVSDCQKNEVRRWKIGETNGTLVAGGNGEGDHLNQFDFPTYIFVDEDDSVYVSDFKNHRVMKWVKGAKEGIVVAGGQGEGESLTQLSEPQGVIVDHLGHVYVADYGNDRIMRWCSGSAEGTIAVGGNEEEQQPNHLSDPVGLSFDRQGNLYVVDWGNNQVGKFDINMD